MPRKSVGGRGSAPHPTRGAYSALQRPRLLARFQGAASRRETTGVMEGDKEGGKERWRGKGRRGKDGKEGKCNVVQ